MTRSSLRHVLSSALLAALAAPVTACGGTVIVTQSEEDGGSDAADAKKDDDAPLPFDTSEPDTFVWDEGIDTAADTIIEIDGGMCSEPTKVDTSPCNESVTYPCGLPIKLSGPSPTPEECKSLCEPVTKVTGGMTFSCWMAAVDGSPSTQVYCASCAVGRRPAGLRDDEPFHCVDPVADALSEMARIEAASVHAFRRLDAALAKLDAPVELRTRARSAARDEIRHARIVSQLARKRGGARRRVRIEAASVDTFDLALENAVEGCVKETIGVAYLAHQAAHAEDPELREMAKALYEDELAHASLSWDLVALFDEHLDDAQKQAIRAAQRRALDTLAPEAAAISPTVRRAFGLPDAATVTRLVGELRSTLYA